MKVSEWFEVLSLNPRFRIVRHVEYLRKNIEIKNSVDKKNFSTIYTNFKKTERKLSYYQWARVVVFILLYASAVNTIFPFIGRIFAPVTIFQSAAAVTLLTLLLIVLLLIINTIMIDLLIEHSHLVSLAVKHNKDFHVHPVYKYGLFTDYK